MTRNPPDDGPRDGGVHLRPMLPDDLDAALEVYYAAQDDLMDRTGQPRYPRNPAPLRALLGHLQSSDPGRSWVATEVGESEAVVAFGAGFRRETLAFLSFLFVRPEAQARGVGRSLFARCLPEPEAPEPRLIRACCVDSLQPKSTGLYAQAGLVPRTPIHTLIGALDRQPLPPLPDSMDAVAFERVVEEDGHAVLAAAVEGVDREVLGWSRAVDHRFWRMDRRRGLLLRDASDGTVAGYGYAQPSGRLGPLVVRDPALGPALVGALTRVVEPAGAWQAIVPGPFEALLRALLAGGMRIDGSAGLLCATAPIPGLERALPAGYAHL